MWKTIGDGEIHVIIKIVFYSDQLGWVFYVTIAQNQPFLVGLVYQIFRPTWNVVEMVENDGYQST